MYLTADVDGEGEVTLDLASQIYTLGNFNSNTTARGAAFTGGDEAISLGANVVAALDEQRLHRLLGEHDVSKGRYILSEA